MQAQMSEERKGTLLFFFLFFEDRLLRQLKTGGGADLDAFRVVWSWQQKAG